MAERNGMTGEGRGGGTGSHAMDETFEALTSEAKARAAAARAAAQHGARRVGEQLRQAAESLLQEQKDRAAAAAHGLAEALRQAADTLDHDDRAVTASYAAQAAAQVERLSEIVRNREIGEMVASAEDFARRQPGLFIAGAVAAGFVVGRLLTRPAEQRARGYAMTNGEDALHAYDPDEEPLAGYGPIVGGEGV